MKSKFMTRLDVEYLFFVVFCSLFLVACVQFPTKFNIYGSVTEFSTGKPLPMIEINLRRVSSVGLMVLPTIETVSVNYSNNDGMFSIDVEANRGVFLDIKEDEEAIPTSYVVPKNLVENGRIQADISINDDRVYIRWNEGDWIKE